MKSSGGFTFRRKANDSRSEGFTLVEVLIAMTVAVLVGGLLMTILVDNTGIFYRESAQVHQGLNLNDSLSQIRSYVKGASAISDQYPESGASDFISGLNQLVLKLPAIDSSGNTIENVFDFAVFHQEQNLLRLKVFPNQVSSRSGLDQVLTANVESVNFSYFDSSNIETIPTSAVKVRATLIVKFASFENLKSSIATSEASLRND